MLVVRIYSDIGQGNMFFNVYICTDKEPGRHIPINTHNHPTTWGFSTAECVIYADIYKIMHNSHVIFLLEGTKIHTSLLNTF